MSDLLRTVRKDLLRRARDPLSILLWLAIPLAIAVLFRLAFGGDDGKIPAARVAVADLDGSVVSRLLPNALGQGQLADLIEVVPAADSLAAYELAQSGKVSAALIIPKGFGDALLDERTTRLVLFRNPAQQVLPSIAEEILASFADAAFYARELLAEPLSVIRRTARADSTPAAADFLDDATALSLSRQFERLGRDVAPRLLPPALSVSLAAPAREPTAGDDYFFALFPGLVFMSLLFTAQALAGDLWDEHTQGTYRRHQLAPRGARTFLWGKTIAAAGVLFLVQILLLSAGRFALGLEFSNLLAAAAFTTIAGFAFVSFLHWIAVIARRENDATVLMSFILMPLVLLGGSFFPIREMPGFLRAVAERTPNGWLSGRLEEILAGRPALAPASLAVALCLVAGTLFTLLADRQARRRFLGA